MAYLKSPVIVGQSLKWLLKERAKAKKKALLFPKNLKSSGFRATEKLMKYKKQKYFG
tara:strand:+ start:57 stop:227 length:171 start_codon:yes stop_codon:yes gene_type:complete